jgi:hypothetical protein
MSILTTYRALKAIAPSEVADVVIFILPWTEPWSNSRCQSSPQAITRTI